MSNLDSYYHAAARITLKKKQPDLSYYIKKSIKEYNKKYRIK